MRTNQNDLTSQKCPHFTAEKFAVVLIIQTHTNTHTEEHFDDWLVMDLKNPTFRRKTKWLRAFPIYLVKKPDRREEIFTAEPRKEKKKRDHSINGASDGKTERRQKRSKNLNLSLFFLKNVSFGALNKLQRHSVSASVSYICQSESVLHLYTALQSQQCLWARHFELSRRLSWPTPICRPSVPPSRLTF